MDDIRHWLERHALSEYVDAFVREKITVRQLADLTEEDLRELGLPMGPRKDFLRLIREGAAQSPPLASPPELSAGPALPPEAERRQLTVMFCDLVGSTVLSESMDPEDYRDVLTAYQTAASKAISEHGGFIARIMGDGLLVYFGYPLAQENDPERAARAGLEIVKRIADIGANPALRVRIGIATGPVVVGDIVGEGVSEEAAALGETPNLAARLQSAASPNSVLLSPTTHRLLRGRIATEPLSPVKLKGFSSPVAPYRAIRARSPSEVSESLRFSAPLVGREVELALLERAWRTAKFSEGQAVLLLGDAGLGKSRLLRSFDESIDETERTRILWYCSPYHQTTANYPAIDQLKRALHLEEQGVEAGLVRLRQMLSAIGLDPLRLAPIVAHLLAIPVEDCFDQMEVPSEELRTRLTAVQVEMVVAAARLAPVLFIVEDLHWADPTTLEVLAELIDAIQSERVLLLMTARPEFSPAWSPRAYTTVHTLSQLTHKEVQSLVESIAAAKGLPEQIVAQVVHRTDGVPLFVEELTSSLLEAASDGAIPASLQDALMARLDRLGSAKELAQMASVIGRDFSPRSLSVIAGISEDEVERRLRPLAASGLIQQRRGRRGTEFEFKHALVRDAAYESMLRDKRRRFHAALADALVNPDLLGRNVAPELIANHYEQAGNLPLAIRYWLEAGNQSNERWAYREARSQLQKGLQLLKEGKENCPDQLRAELAMHTALGAALIGAGGYASDSLIATYERAGEICQELGDPRKSAHILYGLARAYYNRARFSRATELVRRIQTIAKDSGDTVLDVASRTLAGVVENAVGQFGEAQSEFNSVASEYDDTMHEALVSQFVTNNGIVAAVFSSQSLYALGSPGEAFACWQDAIARAERLGHPLTLAFALGMGCITHYFLGDLKAISVSVERGKAICEEYGFKQWDGWISCFSGYIRSREGGAAQGPVEIEGGLKDWTGVGARIGVPFLKLLRSDAQFALEDNESALITIDDAIEEATASGENQYLAELYRHRANVLLALDPKGRRADCMISLKRATAVADAQRAPGWQLRCAVSTIRGYEVLGESTKQPMNALLSIYREFPRDYVTRELEQAALLVSL